MKAVSVNFKNKILEMGREIDSKITYTINNVQTELGVNDLNSVTPHYEGNILKSVMKQLDIDSNVDIPIGTVVNYRFGLKVGNAYEYVNLGNYVVYSSEKQEDLNSYKIVCYDKMLYSMVDYETPKVNGTAITYPITIRDYITAICSHLGLTFLQENFSFVNYDKEIQSELYLDANGNSLDYTFRDVLDELAQVTASIICIDEDDNLEVRYITNSQETIYEDSLKDINVNFGEVYGPINTVSFKRSADSDVISQSIPSDLADDLKNEISISDNQILSGDDRGDYMNDILYSLYGTTYSINDFSSVGITYLELGDQYSVSIDNTTYTCAMLNDEILVTQGLQENIHTDMPDESVTDYNKTTKDDRMMNRTNLMVDKVNQRITSEISQVDDIRGIVLGNYTITSDATFQANKTYYYLTNDGNYEIYTNYSVGDTIPADTIYELTGSIVEKVDNSNENLQNQINANNNAIQNLRQETSSQFTQTVNSFEASFNTVTQAINNNQTDTNQKFDDIRNYLRYEEINGVGVVTLGTSGSEIVLRQRNDRVYFEQNGNEVAYISNNQLYITDAQFLNSIRIGNFAFIPRSNGSLGFRKVS